MHATRNQSGFGLIGVIITILLIAGVVFAIVGTRSGSDDTETRGQDAIQKAQDLSDKVQIRTQ